MNIVFLMDPIDRIIPHKDTTLVIIKEALNRGHSVYYAGQTDISYATGTVSLDTTKINLDSANELGIKLSDPTTLAGNAIDVVFIRPDPPFDEQYLTNTWLLDHLPNQTFVINAPSGIRTANEKIWTAQFTNVTPETLITCNTTLIKTFLATHKSIILKPTNAFGGQQVFKLSKNDPNLNAIIETATDNQNKEVIAQPFIEAAVKGDKRIILLNGEPIGAILRVNDGTDHRNNFYAGGKPVPCDITERDQKIIKTIKSQLLNNGLWFVGIDIIGDFLIEVNVTSPTCVQEINRAYDIKLEEKILQFVEGRASASG